MFGVVSVILGWLGSQVGLKTDTADPSGSLQAKTKSVSDRIGTSADTWANNTVLGRLQTGVKSVQRGSSSITGTSLDIAISAVDTGKTVTSFSYRLSDTLPNAGDFGRVMPTISLTSSTNVRLQRVTTGVTTYVEWEVIEYY